jgi:hypothetical protein
MVGFLLYVGNPQTFFILAQCVHVSLSHLP